MVFSLIHGRYSEAIIWIRGGVYGSGYDYETPFLIKGVGGIWFLLALFWAKIIANDILKYDEKFHILLAILITYVGVKTYSCFVFPWSVQNGMTASLFFVLGHYARKEKLFDHINYIYMLVFFIIWLYCYKYYGTLTMVNCNIPNIMTVVAALCGSAIIIYLSKIIEKKVIIIRSMLEYIGKMTMIILCLHIFELHTGILVSIQNALDESFHISIHIFILRCLWSIGIAIIIKTILLHFKCYNK